MHSYDSDDYDGATYVQLHARRVTAHPQMPKMLFQTAADRRELRNKQKRKVLLTVTVACVPVATVTGKNHEVMLAFAAE